MGVNQFLLVLAQLDGRGQRPLHLGQIVTADIVGQPPLSDGNVAIMERQLPDGGFNIYAGGPSEVSASVKAYFALKLAGVSVDGERMRLLRERILALGGIQAANSYVKVNLSLFDLYPREYSPSIPPEVALLPFDLLYQMSAWTRAIVISLSIVHAANPRRPVPAHPSSPGTILSLAWTSCSSGGSEAAAKPSAALPWRKPRTGWWSGYTTPTAWARSIRR